MATTPVCVIDESGIHAPDFATVRAFFEGGYRSIYGADVNLDPATQDGQLMALFATALHDANQALIAGYNAFSPSTAQGVGLSRVVKINGLARKQPTYSTADLRIVGQVGAVILAGQARSDDGMIWVLPASVTIPVTGEITVTARATDPGALAAPAGSITEIATPTFGWQSVTNPSAATPGQPVETDSTLRQRQALSTTLPSRSIAEGTLGAILGLPGVTRARLYENDGSTQDANGIPGHMIALVVQGGDASQIAQVLAAKKASGVGTYGSTIQTIADTTGAPRRIGFSRPRQVAIQYVLEVKALPGFSVNVITAIQAALSAWTGDLGINEDVMRTRAFVPANLPGDPRTATFEILTLRVARDGRIPKEQDIPMAFNEMASCVPSSVVVRVVAGAS